MQEFRPWMSARLSAETSAPANLDEALGWLIESQYNPVRLGIDDLPALGQDCWLKLALPITAPRAVICALWLIEDVDNGGCVLAGHLRFVGHPTGSETRLSFSGRTATPIEPGHDAARQLLGVIAASIESRSAVARAAIAS
jgi:hypothetical protein